MDVNSVTVAFDDDSIKSTDTVFFFFLYMKVFVECGVWFKISAYWNGERRGMEVKKQKHFGKTVSDIFHKKRKKRVLH